MLLLVTEWLYYLKHLCVPDQFHAESRRLLQARAGAREESSRPQPYAVRVNAYLELASEPKHSTHREPVIFKA